VNSRQLALQTLRAIAQKGLFPDVALDQQLSHAKISRDDRRLATELVYGCIRRAKTLDYLITTLAQRPKQPPLLRLILHVGLYQLAYLPHIPVAAAVDTTVELAKANGFTGLTGFINGLLRQYLRRGVSWPESPVECLATQHSFPEWLITTWLDQWGFEETESLCQWFNQSPSFDLRVNCRRSDRAAVQAALAAAGMTATPLANLPTALRLNSGLGSVQQLPGFREGWWTIQDASAQLVSHLLDPQPGEVVVDACAAPGGKTTHIAELMDDQGQIWACDTAKRLGKLQENCQRLGLNSIRIHQGDSRQISQFAGCADRILVDVPCSGLGTLHRHPDIRWRQTPAKIAELLHLQGEILANAATWAKPGAVLVYATCTLNPKENEAIVTQFLAAHPHWQIIDPGNMATPYANPDTGWVYILPHHHHMDGFFMVKLRNQGLTRFTDS